MKENEESKTIHIKNKHKVSNQQDRWQHTGIRKEEALNTTMSKRRPLTGQVSTGQRIDSGQVSTRQRKSSQGLQREVRVHFLGDTCCWRKVLNCLAFPILAQVNGQFCQLVMFSYDIKEIYKYLSVSDDLSEVSFVEPELGVLKDCLTIHFVVWLMREFRVEKSWTQLLNVSYEYLQTPGRCLCPMRLLYMSEHDNSCCWQTIEAEEFVLYNKR
ncbi:hypothetical protein HKD37_10G028236 [Glycine soja]